MVISAAGAILSLSRYSARRGRSDGQSYDQNSLHPPQSIAIEASEPDPFRAGSYRCDLHAAEGPPEYKTLTVSLDRVPWSNALPSAEDAGALNVAERNAEAERTAAASHRHLRRVGPDWRAIRGERDYRCTLFRNVARLAPALGHEAAASRCITFASVAAAGLTSAA